MYAEPLVESRQVRLYLAGFQQMDAAHRHAVGVQERLRSQLGFLAQELPLGGEEPAVVMVALPGDAPDRERAQSVEEVCSHHYERREDLFQYVPVVPAQEP